MKQEQQLIMVARKPLSEKSVADNVLKWGTGGINIDASRIETSEEDLKGMFRTKGTNIKGKSIVGAKGDYKPPPPSPEGRFPANIILDEEAAELLDEQSGISKSIKRKKISKSKGGGVGVFLNDFNDKRVNDGSSEYTDEGGASRYFKIIKKENDNMKKQELLLTGDNMIKLKEIPDNSIDSVVTDPPYGLKFMNKKWDYEVPSKELWTEVLRVLKPGGHVLSFGGTRTYHRMVVNCEDAGFEIRDCISWLYGSGFPKSHNIGKAIDKKLGNEREVVGKSNTCIGPSLTKDRIGNHNLSKKIDINKINDLTKGSSKYEGWGTALKPATEKIVLARKPYIKKGTIKKQYIQPKEKELCGIILEKQMVDGMLNGVKMEAEKYMLKVEPVITGNNITELFQKDTKSTISTLIKQMIELKTYNYLQRENILIYTQELEKTILKLKELNIEDAKSVMNIKNLIVSILEKVEHIKVIVNYVLEKNLKNGEKLTENTTTNTTGNIENGSSRFFYCAKVSKKERNAGCEEMESVEKKSLKPQSTFCDECGNRIDYKCGCNSTFSLKDQPGQNNIVKNSHPTVKPIKLMEYLIKLVTPEGGLVLDPFMGSGSTGIAAVKNNFRFVGIEMDEQYVEIAKARINHYKK